MNQSQQDIYHRPCRSEPNSMYPIHSADYTTAGPGTSPTSLGNVRDHRAACSSAPFAFSAHSSLGPAVSTSTASNAQGILNGQLMMPKGTGPLFPMAQQGQGKPLRRMASLYNEVTADGRAGSDSLAGGRNLDARDADARSVQTAPDPSAMHSVGAMSLSDAAPVLFKEDTLKTLQREAGQLGNIKPSASEPANSQCSGHMKSSGLPSAVVEERRAADCSMGPSVPQGAGDADAHAEPAWFNNKLSPQPTLSVMCSEVPGSWDPLMAFPVEIAKEGSGEHNAPREASLSLQPHSAGPSGLGTSPALRIEVLNTGLNESAGDRKGTSCANTATENHAVALRGTLRSAKSAPGPSGKVWPRAAVL